MKNYRCCTKVVLYGLTGFLAMSLMAQDPFAAGFGDFSQPAPDTGSSLYTSPSSESPSAYIPQPPPPPERPTPAEKWQPPVVTPPEAADDTRGNWYRKRDFFQKAHDVYQQIRKVTRSIDVLQEPFFQKRADIDNQIAAFNHELGFEQGVVNEQIDMLTAQLEKERGRMIELTEEERKTLKELQDKKQDLENLKKDLALITQRDGVLDEVMARLLQQSSRVRDYEQKALESSQDIARVLNDTKAEQLYNDMVASLQSSSAIQNYISQDLSSFLDTQIGQLQASMEAARGKIALLKSRGVELARKIIQEESADQAAQDQEVKGLKKTVEEQKKALEKVEQEKKAQKSWYKSIWNWITYPFFSFYNLFFRTTPVAIKRPDKKAETPVTTVQEKQQ